MIKSFAKVNLNLKVYEKTESDKFHKINSLVTLVEDLYDEINIIEIKNGIQINSNLFEINNENNLVYIAIDYLVKKHKINKGFKVEIVKKIPIGSGLGGANSNAISVAKEIVNKYNLKDDLKEVCKITGMDSYFFNSDFKTALVSGYGEIVKKHKDINILKSDLIITNINCQTKKVYNEFSKMPNNNLENSLTIAAMKLYPDLLEYKEHRMSGSGSTFIKANKIKRLGL